jgi:HEAT repeat protein
MMSSRKHKAVLIVGLLLLCGGTAFYFWRESPDQKVPRLLWEMRDLPHGKFEIFYFGRSHDQIQADFDRLGPRAVPGLIEGLKDPYPTVRYFAAGQLGRIGDRRAVEPLLASLNDPDFIVQYWAVSALGDIGDNRAVDSLIPLLKNKDPGFRFRAAQALGQIGDKRAYEPLLALREDPELYPRAHAVEALGRVGDERAFEVLSQILAGDDDSWIRSMAARGLGYLGDRRAIPALTKAATDENWQISGAAKESLSRFKRE